MAPGAAGSRGTSRTVPDTDPDGPGRQVAASVATRATSPSGSPPPDSAGGTAVSSLPTGHLVQPRRITPSRSAHGQISSSSDAEQVHRRLGDQRARQQLAGPALGDARQLRRARPLVIAASLGTHSSR